MSTLALTKCDVCGKTEAAEGSMQNGWGTLTILDRGTRDVCPRCISKVLGWKGVSGDIPMGRRVRSVEVGAAL